MLLRLRKFLALSLSVLTASSAVMADLGESHIWAGRHKARQESVSSNNIQLASLPVLLPPARAVVSSSVPTVRAPLASSVGSSLLAALPPQFGTVRDVSTPAGARGRKTVILIQDVHQNEEAQRNIGRALGSLFEKNLAGVVGLEGAADVLSLEGLRGFPMSEAVEEAADYLLRKNLISGAVHAALIHKKQIPPVVGVEEAASYQANVEAYRQSAGRQAGIRKKIQSLRDEANALKEKIFNPALAAFDRRRENYQTGRDTLGMYVEFIAQGADDVSFSIETFIAAVKMERALDFNRVENERARMLDRLVAKLSKAQVQDLIQLTLSYRLGQTPQATFYASLRSLCEKNGVALSRDFPAMDAYIRYVSLAEAIKAEDLYRDVDALEKAVVDGLVQNDQERRLVEKSRRLGLAAKLVDFSLTSNEWDEYRKGGGENASTRLDLSSFENFYREADLRNEHLVENLLKNMDRHKAAVGVLVAGGFHSAGIREKFRREKISSITFTPKITKVDDEAGSKYLGVFTQEKTPLDKLFEGQKLFLAQSPGSRGALHVGAAAEGAVALKRERVSQATLIEWLNRAQSDTTYRGARLNRNGAARLDGAARASGAPVTDTADFGSDEKLDRVDTQIGEAPVRLGKGALVIFAVPIFWLMRLFRIQITPSRKIFIEDVVVPFIEEGLLLALAFKSIPAYIGLRLVFILLHALQDYDAPAGRPRTVFEKILVPFLISFVAVLFLTVGPLYYPSIGLNYRLLLFGWGVHSISSGLITAFKSRFQKGSLSWTPKSGSVWRELKQMHPKFFDLIKSAIVTALPGVVNDTLRSIRITGEAILVELINGEIKRVPFDPERMGQHSHRYHRIMQAHPEKYVVLLVNGWDSGVMRPALRDELLAPFAPYYSITEGKPQSNMNALVYGSVRVIRFLAEMHVKPALAKHHEAIEHALELVRSGQNADCAPLIQALDGISAALAEEFPEEKIVVDHLVKVARQSSGKTQPVMLVPAMPRTTMLKMKGIASAEALQNYLKQPRALELLETVLGVEEKKVRARIDNDPQGIVKELREHDFISIFFIDKSPHPLPGTVGRLMKDAKMDIPALRSPDSRVESIRVGNYLSPLNEYLFTRELGRMLGLNDRGFPEEGLDHSTFVAYFPGLASRKSYTPEAASSEWLYDNGGPRTRGIYEQAAAALGLLTNSRPDASKLFLTHENMPTDRKERAAFIGAAMTVHNLVLLTFFLEKSQTKGLHLKDIAYAGEGFGILAAAIAAGALDLASGIQLAHRFAPSLLDQAREEVKGPLHLIELEGKDLRSVAAQLKAAMGDNFSVNQVYSDGETGRLTAYVPARAVREFRQLLRLQFPGVTTEEVTSDETLVVGVPQMRGARETLRKYIAEEEIHFQAPEVPIISSQGAGILTTREDVISAVFAALDQPPNLPATLDLVTGLTPDVVVEFGLGRKTRETVDENHMDTPFIEADDPKDSFGALCSALRLAGDVSQTLKRLESSQTKLSTAEYDLLRRLFKEMREDAFVGSFMTRFMMRVIDEELLHGDGKHAEPFYQFVHVYQLTTQFLEKINVEGGQLALDAVFKKRIDNNGDGMIDAEIRLLTEDNQIRPSLVPAFKRPETVIYQFGSLGIVPADLDRRTQQLIDTEPLAMDIYEDLRQHLKVPDLKYFYDGGAALSLERLVICRIAYQYVMFQLLQLYRPALFAQNDYSLAGTDEIGQLAAVAASGALTLRQVVELCAYVRDSSGEVDFAEGLRTRLDQVKDPSIPLNPMIPTPRVGPASLLRTAAEVRRNLEHFYVLTVRDADYQAVLRLGAPSWVVTFDAGSGSEAGVERGSYDVDFVRVLSPAEIANGSNTALNKFEQISTLILTDENGQVLKFAQGRRMTAADIYAYVNVGEKIVRLGYGGSGALILILRNDKDEMIVRKISSDRLSAIQWTQGSGVMTPPFEKNKKQVAYYQSVPEGAQGLFPSVGPNIQSREIPIPPHLREESGPPAYKEFIYDMTFVDGIDVSRAVAEMQLPPAIVARLYGEILRLLRARIHSQRRAPRNYKKDGSTLEKSYFSKIQQRLAMVRKDYPVTFNEALVDSASLVIDGISYLNIGPLLEAFRSHPEYLDILEPRYHSFVVGDTNTENVIIGNPGVLAKAKEDLAQGIEPTFTYEDLRLSFLDPRAIGYESSGDNVRDDEIYDHKSPHNSLGNYDKMHGDFFDLNVYQANGMTHVDRQFHPGNPFEFPYAGIEEFFAKEWARGLDLDGPNSILLTDPYYVIRFAFIMGTHFAAMMLFHAKMEEDGTKMDNKQHQKRMVAIFAEGVRWLNWSLEMLQGKRKELFGLKVPELPFNSQAPPAEPAATDLPTTDAGLLTLDETVDFTNDTLVPLWNRILPSRLSFLRINKRLGRWTVGLTVAWWFEVFKPFNYRWLANHKSKTWLQFGFRFFGISAIWVMMVLAFIYMGPAFGPDMTWLGWGKVLLIKSLYALLANMLTHLVYNILFPFALLTLEGPQDMTNKSRLFFSPWIRLARGTGLGPHTIDYDPAVAARIRETLEALGKKVPDAHAYNNFSRLLTELVLDVVDPSKKISKDEIAARAEAIVAALREEKAPYQFVTAAGILLDVFGELELDPAPLVNGKYDLIADSLDKIEQIPFKADVYGYYERVTAYASLFVSVGQLGMKDRLVGGQKNYILLALSQLETIPSPWNRGRGASVLIAAMKALGYESYLFGDRDYIKETLDYIDRADELNIWPTFPARPLTHAYFTIEPYLTMLNTIATLNRPDYFTYKYDRIAKVNKMMEGLTKEETMLIGEYYLLTLYNVGVLDQVIPDLDGYLRDFAAQLDGLNPAPAWFPNGVAYPYAMETLWFFGRTDLITEAMIQRMLASFAGFTDAVDTANWGHPLSYALNVLSQMGLMEKIYAPSETYGGQSPMMWTLDKLGDNAQGLQKSVPMFNHTLISLALRMRGAHRPEPEAFRSIRFEVDKKPAAHHTAVVPGSYGDVNIRNFFKHLKTAAADTKIDFFVESILRGEPLKAPAAYVGGRLFQREQYFAGVFSAKLSAHFGKPWIGPGAPNINYFDLIDYATFLVNLIKDHFQTGANPYEAVNQPRLTAGVEYLKKVNDRDPLETMDERKALSQMIHNILYGNKTEGTIAFHEDFSVANDQSRALTDAIVNVGPGGILDIFVDNMGPEFAANLQMATYLLERGLVGGVRFHVKPYPYSISDVWGQADDIREPVINQTLAQLRSSGDARLVQIADRFEKFFSSGKLAVRSADFLVHNGDLAAVQDKIQAAIPGSKLVIFVGDYLYMKLHGNRKWPHTEDLSEIKRMLPRLSVPMGLIRMVKAPLKWGISRRSAENNTVGMVQVFDSAQGPSKEKIISTVVKTKLLAGMHSEELTGMNAQAVADMALDYHAEGVIPEIGAGTKEGLAAIRRFRELNPTALIAAGEIEEHNVERAVAAAKAGAHVLIALENPISKAVVEAVRAVNPNIVIVAAASTLDEAEKCVAAGVDGIKIRPFASDPAKIPERIALLKELKRRHPGLLVGGSRGVKPAQLKEFFSEGLEFVGLGVKTAKEGAEVLRNGPTMAVTDGAPLTGPADLDPEFRLLHSPWIRLARGTGLGQQPVAYDPKTASGIRDALAALDGTGAEKRAYHRFSRALTELILDVTAANGTFPFEALQARVKAIINELRRETNPYEFAVGAAILMESVGKLKLPASLLINQECDFVSEAFAAIDSITAPYEKTSAYAAVFLALGHMSLSNLIVDDVVDHASRALALLNDIPQAWNRGRAASVLIIALIHNGLEDRLRGGGHDYIRETFDALDRADESYSGMTKDFFKVFPLLTLLNAVSLIKDDGTRNGYLAYKQDRIQQASHLMSRLTPVETGLMTQYYVLALFNLGALDRAISDLDAYMRNFARLAGRIDLSGAWFPNGVVLPYIAETLWMFGRSDLITDEMTDAMVDDLPARFTDDAFAVNRDNPLSYALNTMAEMGLGGMAFNKVPGLIASMTATSGRLQKALPSFDHTLISLALRMRKDLGNKVAPPAVKLKEDPGSGDSIFDGLFKRIADTALTLTHEARALMNGWNRISRGFAIGLFPTKYDREMAANLRYTLRKLGEKVPASNAYNNFSKELTEFILDVIDPAQVVEPQALQARADALVDALSKIEGALLHVNAATLLIETFGKLGLDRDYLVNDKYDVVGDALRRVRAITAGENTASGGAKAQIRGNYDQLISYAQLFTAVTVFGERERLLDASPFGLSYIEDSLSLINDIPSPSARGRYVSALFTALKIAGYERWIYENSAGRDYLKDVFDYIDDEKNLAIDAKLSVTPEYRKAYPLMLLLVAVSVIGKPDYLAYKKDRLAEARDILFRLSEEKGDDVAKHIKLYLIALSNLGLLNSQIPDMDQFLRHFLPAILGTSVEKNKGYVVELFMIVGRLEWLPEGFVQDWIKSLDISGLDASQLNRLVPYNAAIMLTALGQTSHYWAQGLFYSAPYMGGDTPFLKFIEGFTAHDKLVADFLPMVNHAIINYALRMRHRLGEPKEESRESGMARAVRTYMQSGQLRTDQLMFGKVASGNVGDLEGVEAAQAPVDAGAFKVALERELANLPEGSLNAEDAAFLAHLFVSLGLPAESLEAIFRDAAVKGRDVGLVVETEEQMAVVPVLLRLIGEQKIYLLIKKSDEKKIRNKVNAAYPEALRSEQIRLLARNEGYIRCGESAKTGQPVRSFHFADVAEFLNAATTVFVLPDEVIPDLEGLPANSPWREVACIAIRNLLSGALYRPADLADIGVIQRAILEKA